MKIKIRAKATIPIGTIMINPGDEVVLNINAIDFKSDQNFTCYCTADQFEVLEVGEIGPKSGHKTINDFFTQELSNLNIEFKK